MSQQPSIQINVSMKQLVRSCRPSRNGPHGNRLQVGFEGTAPRATIPSVQPLLRISPPLFAELVYRPMPLAPRATRGRRIGGPLVVWGPQRTTVSVVGEFNRWDGRCHQMTNRGATGLWELFIPDLPEGTLYKYELRAKNQEAPFLKADPYAFAAELRPRTASVVRDLSTYRWSDHDWMEARSRLKPLTAPLSIYEVHFGSWMRVPEEGSRWLTFVKGRRSFACERHGSPREL